MTRHKNTKTLAGVILFGVALFFVQTNIGYTADTCWRAGVDVNGDPKSCSVTSDCNGVQPSAVSCLDGYCRYNTANSCDASTPCTGSRGGVGDFCGSLNITPPGTPPPPSTGYTPLVTLTGVTDAPNLPKYGAGFVDFTDYVSGWVKLLIGIGAVLAVIMIVLAGVEYMSTDAIYNKSEAKDKIAKALGGLALLIMSWLILNTVNPNLLKFNLNITSTNTGPSQSVSRCWFQNSFGGCAVSLVTCSVPSDCNSLALPPGSTMLGCFPETPQPAACSASLPETCWQNMGSPSGVGSCAPSWRNIGGFCYENTGQACTGSPFIGTCPSNNLCVIN